MSDLAEHVHTLGLLQDRAMEQTQRLVQLLADHFKRQDAEMAEMRDELLALSNRIEAVTRGVAALGPFPTGAGSGLHSVKVTVPPSCGNPSCMERGVDRHVHSHRA